MREYSAHKDPKGFAEDIMGVVSTWNNAIGTGSQGIAGVWFRNLRYYFNNILMGSGSDSGLDFGGQEGELVKMLVPQARSLNQQFLSIATKQKLNFSAEADSTDAETLSTTRLANGLTQQIIRDQKLDMKGFRMAEMVTMTGFGYLAPWWNFMSGKTIGQNEDGDLLYAGKMNIMHILPTDVIFDHTREDFYDLDKVTVRIAVNRYDLMEKYPRLKDQIATLPGIMSDGDSLTWFYQQFNDDYVYQYHTFLRSSPALENGRYQIMCSSEVICYDDANPYRNDDGAYIPLVQMKPEPITGTGFGYPMFSNILPIQEMLDHSFSAIASNQAANAVQSILNPIGNDVSVANIGGLNFMNYKPQNVPGGGKPEALQLTASSPETYKFIDLLLSHMQMIYNVNSAMRGEPPPGVTSGTAIATLTTNGIEFAQNFIKAYVDSMETVMSMSIYAYKNFASEDMIVNMVGPNRTTLSREFKGADLMPIKRIICRISNPLLATSAGRLEIANNLLQQGQIKDPQAYFDVLEGAPERVMYDDIEDENSLIHKENDDLRDKKQVFALYFDNHKKHIEAHKTLTYDPEIRRNSPLLQSILAHIQEHEQLEQQMAGGMPPQQGQPAPGGSQQPGPANPGAGGGDAAPAQPSQSLVDMTAIPTQGPSAVTGA